MPLIIMCGFPLSGKSFVAERLKSFIEKNENKNVFIVSDDNCGLSSEKPLRYKESRTEKELRAKLKSNVQNLINDKDVIIFDSLNYIKGYRYELYCIAKSRSTPHCIIHCNTDELTCKQRNSNYPNEIFDGLIMRFENPISTNRWDSPLFEINDSHSVDDLNSSIFVNVCEALFRKGAPVPNKATQNVIKSSSNYLQELEQQTQVIVKHVIEMQKSLPPGTEISVPGSSKERFMLRRYQTPQELQRSRRQFVSSLIRVKNNNSFVSHSADSTDSNLADSFIIYLNKCS